jgi:DUF4097 and DUF4098 domain-containing protein YvlB
MMSGRNCISVLVFALIMCVISFAAISDAWADAEEEFHNTYSVAPGTPLSVGNTNGNIHVRVWDKDYVDVLAVKKTNRGKDELGKVDIRVSKNGKLSIETDYLERNARVTVNYTISVPKTVPVEQIKTTNGSVEITGTTGDAFIKTTNGSIKVSDTEGTVELRTTNGNISITGASGIRLAKSTNGSIEVSVLNFVDNAEITTTNGSVTLAVPENINADIDLKTTNGKISASQIQMLVEEISKNHVSGKLGSGGNSITIRTTNGSITLKKM